MNDDFNDDLRDVKEDLASVADAEGDVLCRAALNIIRALEAEVEKLQEENERLLEKSDLLQMLQDESLDARCIPLPTPGGDDADIGWQIISHHMAKPKERVIGEDFDDDLLNALRQARAALRNEKDRDDD